MASICEECQKEIRWIVDPSGNVILCETKQIIIYTERGRKVEGYPLHECKKKGQKSGSETSSG